MKLGQLIDVGVDHGPIRDTSLSEGIAGQVDFLSGTGGVDNQFHCLRGIRRQCRGTDQEEESTGQEWITKGHRSLRSEWAREIGQPSLLPTLMRLPRKRDNKIMYLLAFLQ